MEVLITVGALEPDTLRILPLGLVSRSIQGQNELWLALALTHPATMRLTGAQLAAFLGALLRCARHWAGIAQVREALGGQGGHCS